MSPAELFRIERAKRPQLTNAVIEECRVALGIQLEAKRGIGYRPRIPKTVTVVRSDTIVEALRSGPKTIPQIVERTKRRYETIRCMLVKLSIAGRVRISLVPLAQKVQGPGRRKKLYRLIGG